jgi:hypothetical protein
MKDVVRVVTLRSSYRAVKETLLQEPGGLKPLLLSNESSYESSEIPWLASDEVCSQVNPELLLG